MTRRSRPRCAARRADPRSGRRWSAPTPHRRDPPGRRTRRDTARSGTPSRSPARRRGAGPIRPTRPLDGASGRGRGCRPRAPSGRTRAPRRRRSIVAIVVTGRSEARNRRSGLVRVASAAGTSVRTTTRRASSSSRSNASVSARESSCSNTAFVSGPVAACGSHCGPGMARHVVGDHDEPPVGRTALHRQLHDERSGDGRCILTDDRDGRRRHRPRGRSRPARRAAAMRRRRRAAGPGGACRCRRRAGSRTWPNPNRSRTRNASPWAGRRVQSPEVSGAPRRTHRSIASATARWRNRGGTRGQFDRRIACTPRRRDGVSDGDRAPRGPARYPPRPTPRSTRPRRATRTSVGEGPSRSRSIRRG